MSDETLTCRGDTIADDCRETDSRSWNVAYNWLRGWNTGMKSWLSCVNEHRPEATPNIPVILATPERAFARILRPNVEGQIDIPIISFNLVSTDFDSSRYFAPVYSNPHWHKTKVVKNGKIKWQLSPKPMPWNLTYQVTVWTKFYETLDIVHYEFASRFTPQSYIRSNGTPAEVIFESHSDTSTLESGDTDRVLRHDYSFTVKAWMPLPYTEVGAIENVVVAFGNNPEGDDNLGSCDVEFEEGETTAIIETDFELENGTADDGRVPNVYTSEIEG